MDTQLESLLVCISLNPGLTFTEPEAMNDAIELHRLGYIKAAMFKADTTRPERGPCVLAQDLTIEGRRYMRHNKLW